MERSPLKTILKDPAQQARLDRDGYLVLPMLDAGAVARLRSLYAEMHPATPAEGFYSTTFSPDPAFKDRINASAQELLAAPLAALFQATKPLGASFLNKQPGAAGHMPIHQDWTVCEEDSGHFSCTVWIPLEDVDAQNGAIKVLPGSHRFSNAFRGPTLPVIWREVMDLLEEKMQSLPMKAGEAFIFDHSLLHSSHDNLSGRERLAFTYGLAPAETEICYHWAATDPPAEGQPPLPLGAAPEGQSVIERIFTGDTLFMQHHAVRSRPAGSHQGFWLQDLHPVSREECRALLDGDLKRIERPLRRLPAQPALAPPPPWEPMLADRVLDAQLREKGYAIFPLLDADATSLLAAAYREHHPEMPEGFYASAHVRDTAFRRVMSALVQAALGSAFKQYSAPEAQLLGGSFIAKPPGGKGLLPPHADWNIVDEARHRSYNLWVPLVDTRVENGAVHILPGSHRWFDSYRGPGIPNPLEALGQELWDYLEPLEMQAGHALLYDHRLVHASPLNQSGDLRLACVAGVKRREAEMRHCRLRQGMLAEYASSVDFFLEGDPEEGAGDLPWLGMPAYGFPAVDLAGLRAHLGLEAETGAATIPEAPHLPKRGFWQTYTPGNVLRELLHRLGLGRK